MSLEVFSVPLSCVYSKDSDLILKTSLIKITDKIFFNNKTGFLFKVRNGIFVSISSFGRDQSEIIYVHESLSFAIDAPKDDSLRALDSLSFGILVAPSESLEISENTSFDISKTENETLRAVEVVSIDPSLPKNESVLVNEAVSIDVSKATLDSILASEVVVFDAFKVSQEHVTISESLVFTLTGGLINGSSINGTVI